MDFYCRTFLVSFPSSPLTRRGLTHTFTTLLLLLAAPFQVVLFGASTIPSSFDREKLYLYAVQSAQKRILSHTCKIPPHVTNIPPSSHIPSPPIARTAPHLSRKDPDFPWAKFLVLFWTEPEVRGLFRGFPHYLEGVSWWHCRFSVGRRGRGIGREARLGMSRWDPPTRNLPR